MEKIVALLVELPPDLEEKLTVRARLRGVTPSEFISFLLKLITSLSPEDCKTPFGGLVEAYLKQDSLDDGRLAEIFEGLMASCPESDVESLNPPKPTVPQALEIAERDKIISLLRGGIGLEADRPIEPGAHHADEGMLPPERPVRPVKPLRRLSALGSLAHLDFSTEAFIAEKRIETAREDRPR